MSNTYVEWALYYVLIGFVQIPVLRALVYIFHRKESPSTWVDEVRKVLKKERSWSEKLKDSVSWIGLVCVMALLWPIVLGVVIYQFVVGDAPTTSTYVDEGPSFKCNKKNLVQKVDPLEVERASYVIDPRERVPRLPFGHLYQGWLNLLAQVEPGDELWSFRTKGWSPKEKQPPHYNYPRNVEFGYAILRDKKVIAEFVCEWD